MIVTKSRILVFLDEAELQQAHDTIDSLCVSPRNSLMQDLMSIFVPNEFEQTPGITHYIVLCYSLYLFS